VQRVQLSVEAGPGPGKGSINLRPRPSTIVRAAWLVAALTVLLLAVVKWKTSELVAHPGIGISLLLLAPAGLAAYVARSREPATTDALFGLRLVAASAGLWPFAAALVLAASGAREPASWILWVLLGLSAATALVLTVYLARVYRPPEQLEAGRVNTGDLFKDPYAVPSAEAPSRLSARSRKARAVAIDAWLVNETEKIPERPDPGEGGSPFSDDSPVAS
jgi:hypothetical protein